MVNNPKLWSTENPNLYILRTEILVDGKVVDVFDSRYGFRYFDITNNDGFSLNGEYMKLHGVCMHHDQGALGAVSNYAAIKRQMTELKEMGANAIRVTHNPASDELLQICDELGLLVVEEAFDSWYDGKKEYDYGRTAFEKTSESHPQGAHNVTWAEFDIKQMIKRGKNFPSIIMWSIGNEIHEIAYTGEVSDKAIKTAENLVKWVKEVDKTRKVTIAMDQFKNYSTGASYTKIADLVDVVGLNYSEHNYDKIHADHPDWILYGSETSSSLRSRGEYGHPDEQKVLDTTNFEHKKYQMSSYDNDRVSWGRTVKDSWIADRDRKWIAGEFVWTGFDYIGEPTPWNNSNSQSDPNYPKSSYFGIIDTAGLKKDAYYLYQSQWSEEPMVHILPHWNWEDEEERKNVEDSEGKIPIRVYSNAKSVELFLNGKSLGKKTFSTKKTADGREYQQESDTSNNLYQEWRVSYKYNTTDKLIAIARDEKENVVANTELRTADNASRIHLSADRNIINADGYDLSYITIEMRDNKEALDPKSNKEINLEISGNGKIVGVDNGNPATHDTFKEQEDGTWKINTFNGKAVVIVQSTKEAGEIKLQAECENFENSEITIKTKPVTINNVKLYENKSIEVSLGEKPPMPAEIKALLLDGTYVTLNVKWQIDPADYNSIGRKEIKGIVTETGDEVTADLIVKGEIITSAYINTMAKNIKIGDKVNISNVVKEDNGIQIKEGYTIEWIINSSDNGRARIEDNILYADAIGTVEIQASVTYKGITIQSNILRINIVEEVEREYVDAKLYNYSETEFNAETTKKEQGTKGIYFNNGEALEPWNDWDNNNPKVPKTGIVKPELTEEGNIEFNYPEAGIFSNEIVNGKEIYEHVKLPLQKSSDGFFILDSKYEDYNFENGIPASNTSLIASSNKKTYRGIAGNNEKDYQGFFPFNYVEGEDIDYHFGMQVKVNFYMTEDGTLPATGEDIVFEFSGDDDIWVYIDKKMVLDLGGIHDAISGTINFKTGEITYYKGLKSDNVPILKQENLYAILGEEWGNDNEEKHELEIFFLERGKGESNCSIYYNIPNVVQKSDVIVHHYKEGTTEKLAEDEVINGNVGDIYTTKVSENIPQNYEFSKVEGEIDGYIDFTRKEVIYYYKANDAEINTNNIEKIGTDKITKENEKISYTINYQGVINKYIGDATVNIVDKLPYEIDVEDSDLAGGTYDEDSKTITWTEQIDNIDTYANPETGTINLSKNIKIVYNNIDFSKTEIINKAYANLYIEETKQTQDTNEAETTTITEFKTEKEVTKIWQDNNNASSKRPSSIVVTLNGVGEGVNIYKEQEISVLNKIEPNLWKYVFTDLPKYDESGNKVVYTIDEKDLNNIFYIKTELNQEEGIIVNSFQVPGENVTIPVTKIWDDNDDKAQKRPESVTVQVKNGEEVVAESPITADTEWRHEFTLPKYDSLGNEIKYTIDEADLNNKYYEKGNVDQSAKTITNVSKYGKVIVHYYIEGTTTRVPDINGSEVADAVIEGKQGEVYNTNVAENVKQNYELVATPSNATGTISAEDTEVTYYYRLKTPSVANNITKIGTDRITVSNQEMSYAVTYTAEINDYIGNAEVTIVDTLPYAIDGAKSDLAGGTYDSSSKTITWKENVSDINSYNGNGTVNITKNLKVVYVGLDMNQEKITNNVKGHIKLLTPEKTSDEVTGNQESTIYKAIISSEKLVDKEEATEGEKVTYTIRIKNDGNLAKTVTVRDILPAGITFDKDTLIKVGNLDTVYTEQNLKNGIPVEVPAKGSIDVVFAGKVDTLANNEYSKTLTNQATIDNEPTNEVTTEVTKANITAHKESEPSSGSKVREGDEITYRIRVRNDGTRAGDVIVKDTIPAGTTFVEGSIKIDNVADSTKTATDLQNGITLNVPISTEKVVEFKVRVNKLIDGTKIKNTAYINQNGEDKKVPEEPEHTYVEPKEEQNITKNGTATVESLEQEITYNINYTAKITDYSGRATVKLVDTLPYAIDEARSDLAGGTYDAQAKTITWEEAVENIQITEEKELTLNKTIKVVYTGITQGTTAIKNVVTGHIEYETPDMTSDEVTANSTTTTGFTVNIPVSKVWEDDSNKLNQRPTKVVFKLHGSDGSEYTKEMSKPGTAGSTTTQDSTNPNKWNDIFENLPKYDSNNQEIVYTLTEEEKTEGDLKYYDSVVTDKTVTNTNKYGKVTVHHYIMNTDGSTTTIRVPDVNGTEIPDVVIEGKEGNPYTTEEAKNINAKYELVAEKLPANATGKIEKYNEEKPQEVIYYYRLKPAKVLINYLEKDEDTDDSNNLVLTEQEQIDGHVDDSYNTDTEHKKETIEKDGKTYTLVSDSGNKTGIMTLQDITVTYYYLQNTKATVRYVERDPETGDIVKDLEEPTVKEGLVGDEFVTNSKDFVGYKLVESPEKTTINLSKEEQTLIYYYEPVYTGLIENHIDDKTGKILETKTHEIQVGEDYNIPSKEFEGYDLVESKLPENAEGTMEEELVTVNYYYIKKAVLEVNYIDVLTNEPLTEQIVDETKHEGDSYTTEEKAFENYDMIKVEGNKEGTLVVETDEEGNITNNRTIVTYYYAKKSAGVEEHHIDILTGKDIEEPTLHEGHVGDEYDIKAKEFLSYKLVEADKEGNSMLPENSKGTMTEEKIVVSYYYNQPAKVIVHYIEKATGKELEEINPETGELQKALVIIEGFNQDEYETTAKEFEYYTLIEKPQEEQGKMKVEITKDENGNDVVNNTIELYYYYEAKQFNIGVEKEIIGIIVNGERRAPTNGKLEKVEIYRKATENTSIQVEYKIKVSNTGEVSGNATIEENIPEGMKLANNDGTWEEQEGKLIKVIPELGAGETKEYTVLLNWEQTGENMGEKANEVKLVETGNVPGFVDNNDKDNTSTANVIISIETGKPIPIGLILALVALVGIETVTLRYAYVLTKRQKRK